MKWNSRKWMQMYENESFEFSLRSWDGPLKRLPKYPKVSCEWRYSLIITNFCNSLIINDNAPWSAFEANRKVSDKSSYFFLMGLKVSEESILWQAATPIWVGGENFLLQ